MQFNISLDGAGTISTGITRTGCRMQSNMQSLSLAAATPNPSIEGTSNIWLRQLSAAPHVKR